MHGTGHCSKPTAVTCPDISSTAPISRCGRFGFPRTFINTGRMMTAEFKVIAGATSSERDRQAMLLQSLKTAPLPDGEFLHNLGLFVSRQTMSRLLFMYDLYRMIVPVHGIVCEFGVRWGQNLALFMAFRGMLEPYNYNRTLVGFDTWDGFPCVDPKDGGRVMQGDYGVTIGYLPYLETLLSLHEAESPIAHERKFELVQGDATKTFPQFLDRNPHTVVALAYFDFDLYEPTK